jgi:hypothetical protein
MRAIGGWRITGSCGRTAYAHSARSASLWRARFLERTVGQGEHSGGQVTLDAPVGALRGSTPGADQGDEVHQRGDPPAAEALAGSEAGLELSGVQRETPE